ncbi:hypothetical protein P692DRAFT_201842508 [Suillus brevipes Sb2]|nr:hypothetical protein P692DRAFT_201842508 [Suillus brevipes Sb2]
MFSDELKAFRRLGFRHFLLQILNFASVRLRHLMLWKGLSLILNTQSPIVVVLSGSMEPASYRGDLLFLTNPPGQRYHTGDITVYKIPGAEYPSLAKLKLPLGEHRLMLTKGDNNHIDDIDLYQGLEWLNQRHIVGKVRGYMGRIPAPEPSKLCG